MNPGTAAFLRTALSLVLCAFSLTRVGAQTESTVTWYASDPSGFRLEKITGPEGSAWTLLVSRETLSERTTLYHDGEEKKAWTRTFLPDGTLERETSEEGGILRGELAYDADGRPASERRLLDGGTVEDVVYGYESGRLRKKTTSVDGKVVGTVDYLYAPSGRLVSAIESTGEYWGNSAAKSGLYYSWRASGDSVELRGYDVDGSLVLIRRYSGSRQVLEERRSWLEGALERSIVSAEDGTTTTTSYVTGGAAKGEPWSTIVENGGKLVSAERRDFNENGKLSRLERDEGGIASVIEYQYDAEGSLSQEKRYAESSLVAVVLYAEPGSRVEEAWDRGALYARLVYKDGRKVLEEMIKEGIVVRSRSFE